MEVPQGIFLVERVWSHCGMMCPGVMFTLVIGKVFLTGLPFKRIHILYFFFACPKISHFHGTQLLPFDGVVCNTNGGPIIAVHWYFWLDMAKNFP
jgi:hypothetical protein